MIEKSRVTPKLDSKEPPMKAPPPVPKERQRVLSPRYAKESPAKAPPKRQAPNLPKQSTPVVPQPERKKEETPNNVNLGTLECQILRATEKHYV